MRNKTVVLTCIILLASSCTALAGVQLKINNKDAQEGQILALFNDDLEGGKMTISTPAEDGVDGAEVSFDKGRTWEKMEREGGRFIYAHRPRDGEKMNIVFMFKKASGEAAMRSTNTYVYFQKNRPDEAINIVLQKMKDTYENEQKSRFMDLFSMRFPNRVRFEESIQNDFYNYNNIRLYYRIDRATNDPDYQGAIWDVYWERKFMDRSGTEFSDNAHIAMKFNNEMGRWLIGAMNGNTIFGSSLVNADGPAADLSISAADLVKTGYATINATVHNTSSVSVNNVKVNFYDDKTGTMVFRSSQYILVLSGNSTGTVSYDFSALGPGPVNIKVVVDPDHVISESSRSNNEATKAFVI